jgi:hypothetical protein
MDSIVDDINSKWNGIISAHDVKKIPLSKTIKMLNPKTVVISVLIEKGKTENPGVEKVIKTLNGICPDAEINIAVGERVGGECKFTGSVVEHFQKAELVIFINELNKVFITNSIYPIFTIGHNFIPDE